MSRLGELVPADGRKTILMVFQSPPRDVALGRDVLATLGDGGDRVSKPTARCRAWARGRAEPVARQHYAFQSPPRDVALGREGAEHTRRGGDSRFKAHRAMSRLGETRRRRAQGPRANRFQSPPRDVALGRGSRPWTRRCVAACFKAHRAMSRLGEYRQSSVLRWADAAGFKAHRAMSRLGEFFGMDSRGWPYMFQSPPRDVALGRVGRRSMRAAAVHRVSKPTARCRAWASWYMNRAKELLARVSKPTARCRAWARAPSITSHPDVTCNEQKQTSFDISRILCIFSPKSAPQDD